MKTKDTKTLVIRINEAYGKSKISSYQKELLLNLVKKGDINKVEKTLNNAGIWVAKKEAVKNAVSFLRY